MSKKTVTAIINSNIVLENGIVWNGIILISEDRILDFGNTGDITIPPEASIVDASGSYIGPGFVDLHVHGGNGYSTCFEPDEAARFFLKHGTTTILATPSYSMDFNTILSAIKNVKGAMLRTKTIKGLYMEGPYTNPEYGSHADENPWRSSINEEQYKALVNEAGEFVKVWTVAPERDGIVPFMEYARRINPDVVFAVGHSEATPDEIRRLGSLRPHLQTHSMCATGRKETPAGTRGFGPDEYSLQEQDVFCELISDSCGVHVNAQLQQMILSVKGVNRTVLITDSSVHYNPAPQNLAHVTDLNFDPNGNIAGSKLTMDVACRNIMTHTNCGIAQAFVMASLNGAKVLGMDNEIGSIEKGKKADLVFVDDRFNVKQVMLQGKMCDFVEEL